MREIYTDIFIALVIIYSPVLIMIIATYLLEQKRLVKLMKVLERRVI